MDSNIIELVKLGHERADELKASCGAVDVRSVAQLISDLASQLEVQYVRSNALAAENAHMQQVIGDVQTLYYESDGIVGYHLNGDIAKWDDVMPDLWAETPATDAFLAEVRAQGVEEFLRGSQLPYQIATVLADYDNVDDATLQTVIWSGQPPEPDGDVWHLEYVSRGNAIVRAVLKELRKGVQS